MGARGETVAQRRTGATQEPSQIYSNAQLPLTAGQTCWSDQPLNNLIVVVLSVFVLVIILGFGL